MFFFYNIWLLEKNEMPETAKVSNIFIYNAMLPSYFLAQKSYLQKIEKQIEMQSFHRITRKRKEKHTGWDKT